MVWLKDLWYSMTFPVRYYLMKYDDWKRNKRLKKKIEKLQKQDPFIYKQKGGMTIDD